MDNCLFCKIAAHEVESIILFEDEDIVAFRDVSPQAPVHILVIPKKHIESVDALTGQDGDLLGKIFACIAALARSEGLENGYRVVSNVGPDGGQSVPHLHFHLLGGRTMEWPPG